MRSRFCAVHRTLSAMTPSYQESVLKTTEEGLEKLCIVKIDVDEGLSSSTINAGQSPSSHVSLRFVWAVMLIDR